MLSLTETCFLSVSSTIDILCDQTMRTWIVAIVLSVAGVCHIYAGKNRALLIGISDYPEYGNSELSWNPIHGADDVDLIKGTLRKQGFL